MVLMNGRMNKITETCKQGRESQSQFSRLPGRDEKFASSSRRKLAHRDVLLVALQRYVYIQLNLWRTTG